MAPREPVESLSGSTVGHHCDACPRRLSNGDRVVGYATRYDGDRWRLRRLWCEHCGDRPLRNRRGDPEEALVSGILWRNQLVALQRTEPKGAP